MGSLGERIGISGKIQAMTEIIHHIMVVFSKTYDEAAIYIALTHEEVAFYRPLVEEYAKKNADNSWRPEIQGTRKGNARKTRDYYLAQGCTHPMAQYYASGRKTIVGVVANNDFTLMLTFDNGEVRRLDMKPHLQPGTVFEPIMKLQNFRRVYLDENHSVCWDVDPNIDSTEVWSNKVDICPDVCYVDSIPVKG